MTLEKIKEQILDSETTWVYRAHLISLYHHLQQIENGVAKSGRGNTGWGVRNTAEKLDMSAASVVNYLRLARDVVAHSELTNLTMKKALKTK